MVTEAADGAADAEVGSAVATPVAVLEATLAVEEGPSARAV